MRKPLVVYVSGAPGSGKTTLAKKLSEELFIPHVSSDLIHGGVRLTNGGPNDRLKSLHESYVPILIDMAQKSISFVVDQVLQKDLSKADITDKLSPYASIVYIHTQTTNPIQRHLARELARKDRGRVLTPDELKTRSEFHRQNLGNTAEPVDIGIEPFIVDTTNGYSPSIEEIVDYIEQRYSKEGAHESTN